jgi:nitrite reductase/ring-hydroxylating ferredoxin subunit
MTAQHICMLEELPDNGSKSLKLDGKACFAVRQGQAVYLYRNTCPHLGQPLDLMPDQFLDYDKHYIQCSGHGALFKINTGLCIAGPCHGKSLQPLACEIIDGAVLLSESPLKLPVNILNQPPET